MNDPEVGREQETARSPLTAEDTEQLAAAIHRSAKIRKASKIAAVNGWVLAISAAFTAPFAPFSPVAFLMFIALGILAWNVFRGRKMLEAFQEKGPDLLWKNEVGLLVVVILYCAWGIRSALVGPVSPSLAELEVLLPDVVDLMGQLTIAVYAVIIFATVLFQGSMARFYHTRIGLVRDYLAETPPWTVEVVRIVQGAPAPASTSSQGRSPSSRTPRPAPRDDSPEVPPSTR